jgi:hypothetical protein
MIVRALAIECGIAPAILAGCNVRGAETAVAGSVGANKSEQGRTRYEPLPCVVAACSSAQLLMHGNESVDGFNEH